MLQYVVGAWSRVGSLSVSLIATEAVPVGRAGRAAQPSIRVRSLGRKRPVSTPGNTGGYYRERSFA
jgi:hypothetical protein